jgi:Protein ChrB, N-terminal
MQKTLAQSWLLLVRQLPAQPAYLRVKVWRRLQALGAIPIKNAVHALPMNEGTQEDFEWLLREIGERGGEAVLCEARLIDGISDVEVRRLFDQARDADYDEITKEALAAAKSLRPKLKPEARSANSGLLHPTEMRQCARCDRGSAMDLSSTSMSSTRVVQTVSERNDCSPFAMAKSTSAETDKETLKTLSVSIIPL